MVGQRIHFTSELAPCGRMVEGDHYRDSDDYGLVFTDEYYACGCRMIKHEFHDGSVQTRSVRHDGRVILDECGSLHDGS
ncbi:hypothetical protein [Phytohabitans aurantiacus]|uniref:YopX protein domain-containing protein n=1 Tax=Phytohabitans aurantiacus TaxID=3016789 RepID=A0ABQ5QPD9_9ACTN|nr:hypothetical protein [Phytohabitans aurantiacus]GLH95727.1 hypothetical protein Pa4123_09990 [Phytohabitans aurantiacus]